MIKQFEKQIQNQSQSGRSMIEMLGVLAIIAILSIGGIVGFRLAMNYYQANQIAHEMNMMRTDAQIKIAQGVEELMLGDPYDSGNIQFNGYKTDFDCLYLETETSEPELASCTVANAYYIELQEIPEGVCKPLANLIDKMDNEIAFYINDKSVDATEEKGACNAEFNTLKVIFGADSDSNAVKCDTDAECESLETTPVCDTERHVCVQCTEDDDCPYNTDYCEDNVCKTCESGVWNGTSCVECTEDNDCADTPDTPKCNTTANQCVQCLTYNDCTDTPATPKCNTDTNTCEPCPPKSVFYEDECYPYECRSNEDCADKGADYYCYVKEGYEREQEFVDDPSDDDFGGQCRNASTDASWAENKKYALSTVDMNWYSAFRFCEKLNKRVPSYTDLGYSKGCLGCPTTITQKIKEDFPNVADIWLVEEVAGSSGLVWGFNFERYDLMNQQPKRGGLTDHPVELNYTLCLD